MAEVHRFPVKGCWVKSEAGAVGVVRDTFPGTPQKLVAVEWLREQKVAFEPLHTLRCGFRPGMDVVDSPLQRRRRTLGMGDVVGLRHVGGRDQVLVDFIESGIKAWLPFEGLKQAKGVRHRFAVGELGGPQDAERFRLRILAHAIESWNLNTGALSHLDVDPLPHQIHLVHHIIASGNLNWLIADDVGLGKTIETGMLLAALRQRGLAKRVLIVTPAGLTRQWKDELYYKFGIEDCEIFGEDFTVSEPRQWKLHDYVIGSMDRLKQETHLHNLMYAEDWDLMIVDEGHRLTRRQYGLRYDPSDRFRLAYALRNRVRAMVLLTGTPHQGMQDKFIALLELLRPESKQAFATLGLQPEIIGEMVYRNYKADVTDANGAFVFKGQSTRSIAIQASEPAMALDRHLQDYLRRGYAAGERGGTTGRAIGFVMTIYRKLAASSVNAIVTALQARRARVKSGREGLDLGEEIDDRFVGEWEEGNSGSGREFFGGELELLDQLIAEGERLRQEDEKLLGFLDTLITQVTDHDPDAKVVVFTEYRSTQRYVESALQSRFGADSVSLIHGSMPHDARRESIRHFEETGRFLVSTEAGGEGINLHRRCHIMINYDLPWNPMRLVQRVGRLYRYGQEKRVLVFNLHARGTIDEDVVQMMYRRLESVVSDMAAVQEQEFNERLKDDILGQMAELVDFEEILEAGLSQSVERSQERVDDALRRAREAAEKQRELFRHAAKYDPKDFEGEFQITPEHFKAFTLGMFRQVGIEIVETSHNGIILGLRLPDDVLRELGQRASRVEVTFDRIVGMGRPQTKILDLSSPLIQCVIRRAKAYEFGGLTAGVKYPGGAAIIAAMLRWQDDQGRRVRHSFAAYEIALGKVRVNPPSLGEWLLSEVESSVHKVARVSSEAMWSSADAAAQVSLGNGSNEYLHPDGIQWIGAAWAGDAALGEGV